MTEEDKQKKETVNSFIERNFTKQIKRIADKQRQLEAKKEEEDKLARDNANPQLSTGSLRLTKEKLK